MNGQVLSSSSNSVEANHRMPSFDLQPLRTEGSWFSVIPIGHYTPARTFASMCKAVGVPGFKTNHSPSAQWQFTSIYQACVDKELVSHNRKDWPSLKKYGYMWSNRDHRQHLADILS